MFVDAARVFCMKEGERRGAREVVRKLAEKVEKNDVGPFPAMRTMRRFVRARNRVAPCVQAEPSECRRGMSHVQVTADLDPRAWITSVHGPCGRVLYISGSEQVV